MSEVEVNRWKEEALALDSDKVKSPDMPIGTYQLEADGVATFATKYWDPSADGDRPGLSTVSKRLGEGTMEEIASLVVASRTVHSWVLFPSDAGTDRTEKLERAAVVLFELGSACEYVLDDEVMEPADEALAEAKERAATDNNLSTVVQALSDFAKIGKEIADRLGELGDFEPSLIAEAASLADELSEGGSPQRGRPASPDVELRNRLMTLLDVRVRKVRRAARYVYRNHPDIARLATSAYQRQKRLAAKRKKLAEG